MALTKSDLEAIDKMLAARFEKGCLCGIKPQHMDEMGHVFGMIEDIGEGDTRKGVEVFRKIATTYLSINKKSSLATKFLIGLIVGAAFYGMADVFKELWAVIRGRYLGG